MRIDFLFQYSRDVKKKFTYWWNVKFNTLSETAISDEIGTLFLVIPPEFKTLKIVWWSNLSFE